MLSTAYHLALSQSLRVAVVEKDPRYLFASAMLSAGGIRQQFSLPENIKMSIYGADFLKHPERLAINGVVPDFQFHEHGYLFLASPNGQKVMEQTNKIQRESGATWVDLLSPSELSHQFPWLNTSGIALGSYGRENEGYFDPWSLLSALKLKAIDLGVVYLIGDVIDASLVSSSSSLEYDLRIDQLTISSATETSQISCGNVVNACGPWAGQFLSKLALKAPVPSSIIPLPVKPRKRSIFLFHCHSCEIPNSSSIIPPASTPLTIDPNGVYFRPEGQGCRFICGVSPDEKDDVDGQSNDELQHTDHGLFENIIWPTLYERVPAFGEIKVKSFWSGFYEHNTLDQNAIIGKHSNFSNLFLCNGFSGHGLQQSPAAGRAISELILHNKFQSIDLSLFSFDRIITKCPVFEDGIV